MSLDDMKAHARLLRRIRAALENPGELPLSAFHTLTKELSAAEARFASIDSNEAAAFLGEADHCSWFSIYTAATIVDLMEQIVAHLHLLYPNLGIHEIADRSLGERILHLEALMPGVEISIRAIRKSLRKCSPGDIPSGSYCMLSTNHIAMATAGILDGWSNGHAHESPVVVARNPRGWFVGTGNADWNRSPAIPDDLRAALDFARERHFDVIHFDCDAARTHHLSTYDW